jgi:hypothetical protein
MGTKIEITEELVTKVKALLDQDFGNSRTIARQLGISRWIVKQTYKVLGLYDI